MTEVPTRSASVLILGTAEWDAPIATNQHYVTRELSPIADIAFVESLGLRRPKLSRADLIRMAARARRSVGSARPAQRPRPDGVDIVSPLVVPVHRTPTRLVNRTLLRRATARWLGSASPRVLWTFTPVTYGLELDADIVVYHCVDLLARFPGIDGKAVARGERDLAGRASVAIATSTEVRDHLVRTGFPHVLLLPNVADVSVFSRASQPSADRRPAVLFAGNLSPHKLDVALLESIAQSLRGQADLLLAGPLGAGGGDFGPALQGLRDLGASYLGVLTLPELAGIAGTCTVGLIPYALNAYTRGVSPLKCFEYLASGLGVVGTRIPEVERLAATNPHVHALDAADIPAQVLRLLAPAPDQVIEARVAAATGNGWDERGSVLRDLLTTRLSEWSRR